MGRTAGGTYLREEIEHNRPKWLLATTAARVPAQDWGLTQATYRYRLAEPFTTPGCPCPYPYRTPHRQPQLPEPYIYIYIRARLQDMPHVCQWMGTLSLSIVLKILPPEPSGALIVSGHSFASRPGAGKVTALSGLL